METFKVQQIRSPIRRHHGQRETLIGLRLNKIGRIAEVVNTPETWGMIRKVGHLVRIIDEDSFEQHRLLPPEPWNEQSDERLLQHRVFSNRKIKLQRFKPAEMNGKTPDFRLVKDGKVQGFCEMKSPSDGWLFKFPKDLKPGELRGEVRKGLGDPNLGDHIIKAGQQFEAVNPNHDLPNIMAIVNHAPAKSPVDLRLVLEGIKAYDNRRGILIFEDEKERAPGDKQKKVWDAARNIDLYLWVDARTGKCEPRFPIGAKRLSAACDLLGIHPPEEANLT